MRFQDLRVNLCGSVICPFFLLEQMVLPSLALAFVVLLLESFFISSFLCPFQFTVSISTGVNFLKNIGGLS